MSAPSLRSFGFAAVGLAFLAGTSASWMWVSSSAAWNAHLDRAFVSGFALDDSLRHGAPLPDNITITPVPTADADRLSNGAFLRLSNLPKPAFVTNVSLLRTGADPLSGEPLALVIASDTLRYAVSEIASAEGQSAAQKLGNVTKLLATYCSEPVVFARVGEGAWQQVDGTSVWGCAAAPRDMRLPAVLLAVIALAILGTQVLDVTSHFDQFARALRNRRRLGGPESYALQGPDELREIVSAVNSYLETEREQLSKRAIVLSGVSHDLGTPATRLRLRAALIKEDDLRQKLETDIDRMTEMIESVLTYTRAELNAEVPRRISLTSLVEALVADYQDMGQPVELHAAEQKMIESGRSLFATTAGHAVTPQQPILVVARPISLRRAITNLIDNALKYGRRATVELSATAEHTVISIEDEGSGMSAQDIDAMVAPFKRGDNTATIDGFGLGLTIVATVAEQHGGSLNFEDGQLGVRARLEIHRN